MPSDLTLPFMVAQASPEDDEHPALKRARERLRQQQEEERRREEAPPPDETAHPALERARTQQSARDKEILGKSGAELTEDERRRKIALLEMQREALDEDLKPEQNEGIVGDVGTGLKIGATQVVTGPVVRGEAGIRQREITTRLIANSLPLDDIAGIEQLAGKSIDELGWLELNKAGQKFYAGTGKPWDERIDEMRGFTPEQIETRRELRDKPFSPQIAMTGAAPMVGSYMDQDVYRGMLENMKPEGQPAFPEADELVRRTQETKGGLNFYEQVVRPLAFEDGADAREAADRMAQHLVNLREEYSEKSQAEQERTFLREDATWNPLTWFDPGGETKGLRGIFLATVEQAPMIGSMIVSSRIGGRAGARAAVRNMADEPLEAVIAAQKSGARWGGAVTGGATEMALIRDGVYNETHSRLMQDTPDEMWDQNEQFQQLIESGQITREEAKQIMAYEFADKAGNTAMVISGALMGTPMGAFYGSLTGVSGARQMAKDSILRQMAKGAALETVQEMGQEGVEQISSNLQVMKINPDTDWSEGVAEAMAGAAFVSGPYGALGGIRSDKGSGIAIAKDKLIRESGQWLKAFNERSRFQVKQAKVSEDQSPQERLKNMIELERLQEKEATAFLAKADRIERLLDESGASQEQRAMFVEKKASYETDLAFIAKRKKARLEARRELQEEQRAQQERDQARKQVERDVRNVNESMKLVTNMQKVQRGELLENASDYDQLNQLGYGTWMGRNNDNFVLTNRGQRAVEEMSEEIIDTKQRLEAGVFTGERRTQRVLRESFENLTDEEFERQVFRDPTTGLWNKRKLNEDLRPDSERNYGGFAFLDMDSLKWVNDNMSYSAGNEYMRTVTREIESLGKGIEAYRFGGDEFVVAGPSPEAVQKAVESALGRINRASRISEANKSVKVAVSTGFGATQEEAEQSMKADKKRRTQEGLRQDTRIADSVPPTLKMEGPANEEFDDPQAGKQMTLFAMAAQGNRFNDDSWKSSNYWIEEDWAMYDMAADQSSWRKKGAKGALHEVDPEHYNWIEEAAQNFLPKGNKNNPPITILHDHHWLSHVAPRQYKELLDLPFGGLGVRGMFSMDDPSHGVFLFADVIISEAEAKLPKPERIVGWNTAKYSVKEGDTIEVIDEEGNVERATVKDSSYKKTAWRGTYSRYGRSYGPTKVSQTQKRYEKEAKRIVRRRHQLTQKEFNLLKQTNKMSAEKRRDRNHPVNKALMAVLDELGALESDYRLVLDAINLERSKAWLETSMEEEARQREMDLEAQRTEDTGEDQITVEMRDGTTIKFDPKENAPIKVFGKEGELPNVYLGRVKTPHAKEWRYNLGNEEAATPIELTKEDVQAVVADTIMHEAIGHFGVRGITRDWGNYVKLTHALTDAFPEVVDRLRVMGYNYREDLDRPGQLNEANKALLGEEVMAWTAGEILGKLGMEGLNATQQSAVSQFMTWFKLQLLKMGFNHIYRKAQAMQIRALRRRLHDAKTREQRDAISRKLYGYVENGKRVPGLVFMGESGIRKKAQWKGKWAKTGTVARAQAGFLNDQDLLNIIQRSLDFVRNGRNKWSFKDHAGRSHALPMRDIQMYRKPVHWVVLNATRPRAEAEKITEQDLEPPPPVPTPEEAYELITGEKAPEGWQPATPATFKDLSKEIEADILEITRQEVIDQHGEFDQAIFDAKVKAMRQQRFFPNPKQIFDLVINNVPLPQLEGVAEGVVPWHDKMLAEKRKYVGFGADTAGEVGSQVQSLISKTKKEVDARDAKLKQKRRNVEMLEARFGKEVVENDQIPVFTETATIQGYMEQLKQALPSADGTGFITQMEVDASGVIEKLWPSRVKAMVTRGDIEQSDVAALISSGVFTKERWNQLQEPNQAMTREEAEAIIKRLTDKDQVLADMGFARTVPEMHLHTKKFMANNALTAKDFREYMSDWVLSGHDANITTLMSVYGEESQLVQDYIDAKALSVSGNADERADARERMEEIMTAPINPSQVVVSKDWLAQQVEEPAYDIFPFLPRQSPLDWRIHYEKITGEKPDRSWSDTYDIPDNGTRAAVEAEQMRDRREGPDVGWHEDLQRWIPLQLNSASREWSNLMVEWIVPDSYFGVVFWQKPTDRHVQTGHFSSSRDPQGNSGGEGIWGHMRNAATYDADPNAPTAPNPDKQGQAFLPFESQSDAFQKASKMFNSEEELNQALKQREIDGAHLAAISRRLVANMTKLAIDRIEQNYNQIADAITEENQIRVLINSQYVHPDYGRIENMDDARMVWNEMNVKERRALKHAATAAKYHDTFNEAPFQIIQDKLSEIVNQLSEASKGITTAASQSQQDVGRFHQGRGPTEPYEVTFVGDARMFEWNDYRAMMNILDRFRAGLANLHTHTAYYANVNPQNSRWKKLVELPSSGVMDELKTFTGPTPVPDPPSGNYAAKLMNEMMRRQANPSNNNMPLHRLPFMEDRFVSVMADLLERIQHRKPESKTYRQVAQEMFDDSVAVEQLDMVIDSQMMADVFASPKHVIDSALHDWQADKASVPFISAMTGDGDEQTISMFGPRAELEAFKENYLESFKEFLAVRLNTGEVGDAESQLQRRQQQLNRNWSSMESDTWKWMDEFELQLAMYRVTDDADNPLALKSDVKANGLTMDNVHEYYEDANIQNFPDYTKERWRDIWDQLDEEERSEQVAMGGSEERPTDEWYERFANEWNNSTPGLVIGRIPIAWNQQSEATDWQRFRIVKQSVTEGDMYQLYWWNEERSSWDHDRGLDWWDIEGRLPEYINYWYEEAGIDTNPWRFKTLRPRVRKMKQEIKQLQEQIASGKERQSTKIEDLFANEAAHPIIKIDGSANAQKAFLRVINHHKKKHDWRREQLIGKNDQWRNAHMMYAISEAVRQGYARIHLAYGSASGQRGGFLSRYRNGGEYWHYANSAKYTLKKQMLRGEERHILELKLDNAIEPFWIDVTDDNLMVFQEDREQGDIDVLDGYVSSAVTTQLGRDVSRIIGRKLMESHTSGNKTRLLVTGSGENWFVVDGNANVISTHPSKRAAQNRRREIEAGQSDVEIPTTLTGTISRHEIGGPLMLIKSEYYGGTVYNLENSNRDQYQHTFQPPTFAGMRMNYDVVALARYRAYLKQFGLDIEEGWAKIENHVRLDAQYAEGGRLEVEVAQSFADKYPNMRVEEVQGDTYGWIVASDNGLVTGQIFANSADADAYMSDLVQRNSTEKDGRVKVYQITINDALREEHSKPVNPWVNAHWQINRDDPILQSMLRKIGEPKRSWWDNYNPFNKALKATFVQGAIDRFFGLKFALQQTGKSLDSYKMARLTTGIDSIMRAAFEYGRPVWRDGVMSVEGEGLLQALAGVSDNLEMWAAYMAGLRAKQLILEGYYKLDEGNKRGIDQLAQHFDPSRKGKIKAGEHQAQPPYTEAQRNTEAHAERVWNALLYVMERHEHLMPKFTRRTFMRGLGAAGAVAHVGPGKVRGPLDDLGVDVDKARELVKEVMSSRGGSLSQTDYQNRINRWVTKMLKSDPDKWGVDPEIWGRDARNLKKAGSFARAKEALLDALEKEKTSILQAESAERAIKEGFELLEKDAPLSAKSFDELIEAGREKNFDALEAQKAIQYGEQFDEFAIARQKYNRWRKGVLDFAEEAGVINPTSRAAWEEADYIPFFRIKDDRLLGPAGSGNGITDLGDPIKRLKGAAFNTGDLIHNMFIGASRLIDSAVKNNAAVAAVRELEGTGLIRKMPKGFAQQTIPGTEVEKIFKTHGLDTAYIPDEIVKTVHSMFGIVPPKGDGIINVMIDGKPEYYRTEDELLYRALTSVNHNVVITNILRGPKKFLTSAVTLDPGFMLANFVRDSMSAWVLSRDNYIPLYDGLRGALKSITTDETMQAMMAAGASFESGYIRHDDPASTHRYIQQAMKDAGFRRTVLDGPRKLFRMYQQFGSSLENANRVAIYEAALRAGKSPLQAAFEAKDIMDFSMGGDWAAVQYLVQSVPFFNARLQGLYRLQRGARENPLAFAFKGLMITIAGMGLWFKFRDDERYKRLEDWDKDAYFHFWVGEHHWRIPKGFEVGAIFNTIPERAFEYLWSNENDDGKLFLNRMGHMFLETFAMNPTPQLLKPWYEFMANKNTFTDRDIESPWEQRLLPQDRYRYYTSPTMIEGTNLMPRLDTALHGKLTSPLHWQNLYNGYTGTLGRYALLMADAAMRHMMDYPEPPEWRADYIPVVSRFYRGKEKPIDPEYMRMTPQERARYDVETGFENYSARGTRYEQAFYDDMRLVTMAMNSLRNARKDLDPERGDERFREIEREYIPYLERSNEYERFQDQLSRLNREVREINASRELDGAEKRRRLDAVQREKQAIYKEAYERRPSAMPEEEIQDIRDLIDSYGAGGPVPEALATQAPVTADLLQGISTEMNSSQLERLAKSANYTPQER